jgi:hypothetical protein
LDELCARADAGDQNAAGELAVLLAKRGDLDCAAQVLRARADADADAGTACGDPSSGTVSGTINAIISFPYGHRTRPQLKACPSATVRQASGSRRGTRHLPADPRGPTAPALSARTQTRSPRFLPIRRQLPS